MFEEGESGRVFIQEGTVEMGQSMRLCVFVAYKAGLEAIVKENS